MTDQSTERPETGDTCPDCGLDRYWWEQASDDFKQAASCSHPWHESSVSDQPTERPEEGRRARQVQRATDEVRAWPIGLQRATSSDPTERAEERRCPTCGSDDLARCDWDLSPTHRRVKDGEAETPHQWRPGCCPDDFHAPAPPTGEERDWTTANGRSNSSPEFNRVVALVTRLIRDEARSLVAGRTEAVARLIVAQLAHREGFAPPPQPREGGEERWRVSKYAPVGEGRGGTRRWKAELVGPQPTNNAWLVPLSRATAAEEERDDWKRKAEHRLHEWRLRDKDATNAGAERDDQADEKLRAEAALAQVKQERDVAVRDCGRYEVHLARSAERHREAEARAREAEAEVERLREALSSLHRIIRISLESGGAETATLLTAESIIRSALSPHNEEESDGD